MPKPNIHSRISVNQISSASWSLEQDIAGYQALGIETLGVAFTKFSGRPEQGVELLQQAGFKAATMVAFCATLIESGDATLQGLHPAIDAAAALNCPSLYTVSGATPPHMSTDQAYALLVKTLQPANAYAKSKGVRLGIEHTSPATRTHGFVHSLADAIDLSREADIGICLELQNCWYERNLARNFRENINRFIIVQCSDFRVGEELRNNRRVPGEGGIPLEWMIGLLLDAGYQGYFDLEILGPAIEAEGYASAITRAAEWLTNRLTSWGV